MLTARYKPQWTFGGLWNHSVNSSSHSVIGDIAIQLEWSNFDHSYNPNPLTDYHKTLHNWLRPRDEHVTPNMCQSAVRERLAKYVKYKVSLCNFYFYFFPDSFTEVTRVWNFTRDGLKHALWRKEVPFWGPHDGRQHFGVQIPQNRQKWPSISTFERPGTDSRRMASYDWRHWLRYVVAERRILFIASGKSLRLCIFKWLRIIFGTEI